MTAKQSNTRSFIGNLEKILIALIFVSILVYYVVTGNRELKTSILYTLLLLLEVLLLLYYIYLTKNLFSLFLIGYIILNIGFYLQLSGNSLSKNLILAGEFSQFFLGLFLGYKTFKDSMKNKDWEMFGTLLTLALIFPILYHYFLSGKELLLVYEYALPFLLGIIVYNENLWDKYNNSEKKILTYILVSSVAEVLFISMKLF
ncbi:MAG TPA: hypothetical protein VNW06_09410 [Cytophagaceae bacterium]|jgi:hypothetical protein|nr:hypothetical protein [Cytophagaceae bacterium]